MHILCVRQKDTDICGAWTRSEAKCFRRHVRTTQQRAQNTLHARLPSIQGCDAPVT